MDKSGTQINGPEDKTFDDHAQYLKYERWQRLYFSGKEGEGGFANSKECVEASIRGIEDNMKKTKNKKRLNSVASNSNYKIRTNSRTTKSRK